MTHKGVCHDYKNIKLGTTIDKYKQKHTICFAFLMNITQKLEKASFDSYKLSNFKVLQKLVL